MWKIYDELIDSVPENVFIQEYMIGKHWTIVRSDQGMGLAKTVRGEPIESGLKEVVGMPLKKLASYVKSWNMGDASLGLAAINAALNNLSNVTEISVPLGIEEDLHLQKFNAFTDFAFENTGKNVAFVGHFPKTQYLRGRCNLTIIDKNPQYGDLPDTASEYILPYQDLVFITGTAFINKNMPRLLKLSEKPELILIGPSVPISPILFQYGVNAIAGMIIVDEKAIWKTVQEGGNRDIYQNGGQSICLDR